VSTGQTEIGEEGFSLTLKAALSQAIVQDHVVDDALRILTFRFGRLKIKLFEPLLDLSRKRIKVVL
jgi:hypothetical protein